jgi:Flp pilus assembly pilin Flp
MTIPDSHQLNLTGHLIKQDTILGGIAGLGSGVAIFYHLPSLLPYSDSVNPVEQYGTLAVLLMLTMVGGLTVGAFWGWVSGMFTELFTRLVGFSHDTPKRYFITIWLIQCLLPLRISHHILTFDPVWKAANRVLVVNLLEIEVGLCAMTFVFLNVIWPPNGRSK